MSTLKNKIDFVALVSVNMANANGDPLNGNRPRTDYNGLGEMSDVCIKRKIRNRMQDLGNAVFVQSEDRCNDGFGSLSERAAFVICPSCLRILAGRPCLRSGVRFQRHQRRLCRRARSCFHSPGCQHFAGGSGIHANHQKRQRRKERKR